MYYEEKTMPDGRVFFRMLPKGVWRLKKETEQPTLCEENKPLDVADAACIANKKIWNRLRVGEQITEIEFRSYNFHMWLEQHGREAYGEVE